MAKYLIWGGKPLQGEIKIGGAKNAALKMIASAVLTDDDLVLENVPSVTDVESMLQIFRELGGKYKREGNKVILNARTLNSYKLEKEITGKLRASVVFAGPLLARFGKVQMPHPGGCSIGPRPIDYHLKAFVQLGAKVKEFNNHYEVQLRSPKNNTVYFDDITVTGTENILLYLAKSDLKTSVRLAASEPEVQDLMTLLNKMGAKIRFNSLGRYEIEGAKTLKGAFHKILPDRIVGATFAIFAAATRGKVKIKGFIKDHNDLFLYKLQEIGVPYQIEGETLEVLPPSQLLPTKIVTRPYPGFPTDLQAPFSLLLLQAKGRSRIFETIFDSRLKYLGELKKMGAKVEIVDNHNAYIDGPSKLKGCKIDSLDLRAGATLVGAALIAEGESVINNAEIIQRGYENLDQALLSLGAQIERKP